MNHFGTWNTKYDELLGTWNTKYNELSGEGVKTYKNKQDVFSAWGSSNGTGIGWISLRLDSLAEKGKGMKHYYFGEVVSTVKICNFSSTICSTTIKGKIINLSDSKMQAGLLANADWSYPQTGIKILQSFNSIFNLYLPERKNIYTHRTHAAKLNTEQSKVERRCTWTFTTSICGRFPEESIAGSSTKRAIWSILRWDKNTSTPKG